MTIKTGSPDVGLVVGLPGRATVKKSITKKGRLTQHVLLSASGKHKLVDTVFNKFS